MSKKLYPNLFSPIKLRDVTIKNRIMSAPNLLHHVIGGRPDDHYIGFLEHKARGGAAIINLGECGVCDGAHHVLPLQMTQENLPIYGEISAAIHEHGALASAELTHGGINASGLYNTGKLLGPVAVKMSTRGYEISAMTEQDMINIADAFATACEYWLLAGFDAVHVHAGHTWLFPQFLSPFINTRDDAYGGSFENRMRFPLMVLKRMREQIGDRMVISLRQSGSERREGGFTTDDISVFLEKAQEYIDMVEITTEQWDLCMPTTYVPWGVNVELAEAIKKTGRVKIPVFVVGSILDPAQAEEIITSGKADGVSMARALIADPYLPAKAQSGKPGDITPCLRCQNCVDGDNIRFHFQCSVNPLAGRESRLGFSGDELPPAKHSRRVLVVGGGPAGMKAAVTASLRGHEVTLCEKTDSLGGILKFTENDSLKFDLRRFKEHLIKQVSESNIKLILNSEANDALVDQVNPDHIIVATGSTLTVPTFLKGYENAYPATDIYFAPEVIKGDEIVIVGGGLVGVEAGLHLCNIGKKVTVLEMKSIWAEEAGGTYRRGIMSKAEEFNLNIITDARCVEITKDSVIYIMDGKEHSMKADTVFYAVGMSKNESPYFDLADKAAFATQIGDCNKIGKIVDAIHSGYFSALDIGVI